MHDARDYRRVDVGSDHHLVRAEVKFKLRKQRQPAPNALFAIEKLKDPTVVNGFTLELQNHFTLLGEMEDVEDLWTGLRDTTVESAQNTIRRRRGKRSKQ